MILKTINKYLFIFLPLIIISLNCRNDIVKFTKIEKPDKISPEHAWITGVITEIEPVNTSMESDEPCLKVPCIAKVKISSVEYGSSFPAILIGKNISLKFEFTLNETTEDLFPNMDENYPGLKVGDEFSTLVEHIERKKDDDRPEFKVFGYNLIQKTK